MRVLAYLAIPLLIGCGGDDASTPAQGSGGTAGTSGAAGSGGSAGTSGSSGMGGSGGAAGSSGTGGTGGTAGSSGVGGSGGAAGSAGSGGTAGSGGSGGVAGGSIGGHIAYRSADGPIYLIEANPGAQPFNLTHALDAISPGDDGDVNLSPDGAWLSLITTRFGCAGWDCVVVVDVGLSQPSVVQTSGGDQPHPDNAVAVSSGGDVVVYADAGSNERDLFVMRRSGSAWTAPVNITDISPFDYNTQPAIASDGQSVLFDCSPVPYGAEGTQICEVGIDGTGFRVVVDPSISPNGQSGSRAHSADYAPDGSIVFEGEWGAEQIWRLAPGAGTPTLVGDFGNDNTPCVLPGGWVASFWLNAPNNPSGVHELKVMSADGSEHVMLVQGSDLMDTTLGCGL